MDVLRRAFRARANMSPGEANRRYGALDQVEPARELPPSLISDRLKSGAVAIIDFPSPANAEDSATLTDSPARGELAGVDPVSRLADGRTPAPSLPGTGKTQTSDGGATAGRDRQPSIVTITVAGDDGTTTLTCLIRAELARHGIAFQGPDDLRSMNWRAGLDRHLRNDLRVVIVREETRREASE